MTRELHIRRLGRVLYADGLAMQERLAAARHAGLIPDTLLLLEHPRVLTLGRGAERKHILWGQERLARQGFELFDTNRGGDVTYHGPGQLVGYPILDLKPDRQDVRKYVTSIEELMIRVARDFSVECTRVSGRTGVWVQTPRGPEKLGAIGVHLARWITSHGFALNITTQLSDFGAIVPCGLADAGVCSLQSLLAPRAPPAWDAVLEQVVCHAEALWESEASWVEVELETIAVALVRETLHGDELLLLHRVPERGGCWQLLTGRCELNEAAPQAALREIFEETGLSPRLEELVEFEVPHAFALNPKLLGLPGDDVPRPLFARETMYTLHVSPGSDPVLDAREHDAFRWVSLDQALALLPFAGMKRAARACLSPTL